MAEQAPPAAAVQGDHQDIEMAPIPADHHDIYGTVHTPLVCLTEGECVLSNPPWGHIMLLGFQQFLLTVAASTIVASTVVPIMGGGDDDTVRMIQLFLFMSGLHTLLQTWLGTRLPTVMGRSLVFLVAIAWTVNDLDYPGFSSNPKRFSHTVRAIQGDLILSSILPIVLGYSRLWGKLTRYFSPLVVVSLCTLGGLGLFRRGFPLLASCFGFGLPALLILIVCQYMKRVHTVARSVFGKYTVLVSLGLTWAFGAILTASGVYDHVSATTQQNCRTDASYLISAAPWVKIPYPFQYGLPIFRASSVFGMMGPALVSIIESTGTLYCASRFAGATLPPAYVISRSIGLQGVCQLLSGLFGAPVTTTISPENVGLLGLTATGSRRVIQVSAALTLFFSIFGKFAAFFASIPLSIYGAVYIILLGTVGACGLSFLQFVNTNSLRNIYVLGISLFLGITIPQYFALTNGSGPIKTDAGWFNIIVNTILASSPAVALIVSTIMDNTLEPQDVNDRGISWLTRFYTMNADRRSREFYNLPPFLTGWFQCMIIW